MPYINLDDLTEKEIVKGFKGKFVHSENITIAHWTIDSGSLLPLHKHEHEQIAILLKGKLEFTMKGETKIIEPGQDVIIPSNVEHSGKALTDCHIIDVFYPVREDYK